MGSSETTAKASTSPQSPRATGAAELLAETRDSKVSLTFYSARVE